MATLFLALNNLLVRRGRTALTAAAIALSVSLVVAVTSGYTTVEGLALGFVSRYMGSADVVITNQHRPHEPFDETLVDRMRADPDVKRITGRLEAEFPLQDKTGKRIEGHPAQVIGIRRPADTRIENLEAKAGRWFDTATGNDAVIDQVAAEKLGVGVGDTFSVPGPHERLTLKVVGIVQKPQILADHIQSIYVPLETLQSFVVSKEKRGVNRVMVDLKPDVDLDAFVAKWKTRADPLLDLRLGRDVRKKIERNMQGVHVLSYLGGTVSMLAAMFIIFSALSMGVTERSRTLAMLRAIGAARLQVGGVVVVEGLLLAVIGIVVGTPLGALWLWLLKTRFKNSFAIPIHLSPGGIAYAAVASMAAALVASLLPAWWATRVSPLEALAPSADPPRRRTPWVAAIVGLILISIDPLIVQGPWEFLGRWWSDNPVQFNVALRIYGRFVVGLPCFMLGFFLTGPAFVVVIEKFAATAVAALLGLEPALLRQQLSNGLWRAAGTGAALMVGLAILISMETEGNTMLMGWQLPDKFPDIFIVSWSNDLTAADIESLNHVPGIKPGEVLPIAMASPEYGSASLIALSTIAITPDASLFMGVDPEMAMTKMMRLEFRQGTQADAIRLLNGGDHVLITDELHQAKQLNLGDKLSLVTKRGKRDFTIAGVVTAPGMDLINGQFDMGRQFDQRTAGSIFGSFKDAEKYFDAGGIHLLAANLDPAVDKETVMKGINQKLGEKGMQAGDIRLIKKKMSETFGNLLKVIAVVPLGAMLVASLGVTNTIMASVRTRRWQLGVLRAVGLTRSQLLRMVLAESMLVGLIGIGMGIAAGALMSTDGHEISRLVTGSTAAVRPPWKILFGGVAAELAIASLAGLWPAITTARTQTLSLLQGGRATA